MDTTYQTYSSTSNSTSSTVAAGLILIILVVFFFLYAIPSIITNWKLYSKAGRPGWAAIVPVYNNMVMADIAKKPMWMGIIAGVAGYFYRVPILGTIGGLASLVLILIILSGLIKQYQTGIGFWIAYIFFPLIAVFLVGKVPYIGGSQQPFATGGMAPQAPGAPVAPAGPSQPIQQQPVAPIQPQPYATPLAPTEQPEATPAYQPAPTPVAANPVETPVYPEPMVAPPAPIEVANAPAGEDDDQTPSTPQPPAA